MKKCLACLIAVLLLLSVFAGCSGNTGDGEKVDPNRTQITVAMKNDPAEKLIMNAFKAAFEKENPDIQIIVETTVGTDYVQTVFNYAVSEFPDILWTSGDYHSTVSAAGKFENLRPYYDRDIPDWEEKYHPASMSTTKINAADESIWFAPRDFNQLVVFYNKNAFESAQQLDPSIKDPNDPSYYENGRTGWTWAEFKDTVKKFRALQLAGSKGEALTRNSVAVLGGFTWNVASYTILRGFGGDVFDEEGNVVMDSANAMRAYNEMIEFVKNNYTTSNNAAFNNKLAAMEFGVRTNIISMEKLNFDVAPFPIMEVPVIGSGCSGYAMSASCEHKEEAWKFLKFIISKEGQEIFGQTKASVPCLMELLYDENAAWRQSTPDINNDAFVARSEDALNLNFASEVTPKNQSSVVQEYNNFFFSLNNEKKYQTEEGLASLISTYKQKIADAANAA